MGGEQGQEAAGLAGDLQGLEGLGAGGLGGGDSGVVKPAQGAEGVNHVFTPGQPGTAGIGPVLAPAGEPADHQRPQDGEDDLKDHDEDELEPAAAAVAVVAGAHGLADDEGEDAREEEDEGVDDALNEGHGDHVPVGDVGYFVAENAGDLTAAHALEQAGRDGYQGPGFGGAGGKGVDFVRLINADFGLLGEDGVAGERVDGLHAFLQGGVVGIRRDHLDAHHPLGHDA